MGAIRTQRGILITLWSFSLTCLSSSGTRVGTNRYLLTPHTKMISCLTEGYSIRATVRINYGKAS